MNNLFSLDKITPDIKITAETLGSKYFKKNYGLKYAYTAGSMYKGISSKELVIQLGKIGAMGFLGTGGLSLNEIESSIRHIKSQLCNNESFGTNLLCNLKRPEQEYANVKLFIEHGVPCIEASAYMQITPALALCRLNGLCKIGTNGVMKKRRIIAKVSRPDIAELFLEPVPGELINKLLESGEITREEAEIGKKIPVADDLCVEADSGGHTDMGNTASLLPTIIRLRNCISEKNSYSEIISVGSAGGIGTPEAAASAFLLGADFIVTGSINQCTPEAGTSNVVKDMLQKVNVHDTTYAPAGDMFENGSKVQVMKLGVFFPTRANKLYEFWRNFNSLAELDEKTQQQLQEKYFKRKFDDIYSEIVTYYNKFAPHEIEKAEKNPKHKMSLIFRWYFFYANNLALQGDEKNSVDFQVQCGPSMGAFNQWVKNTELENWQNRNVDKLCQKIMEETAIFLAERIKKILNHYI